MSRVADSGRFHSATSEPSVERHDDCIHINFSSHDIHNSPRAQYLLRCSIFFWHMLIHIIMWHVVSRPPLSSLHVYEHFPQPFSCLQIVIEFRLHCIEVFAFLSFAQCSAQHKKLKPARFLSRISSHSPDAESNRWGRRQAGESVFKESSNWLYWFVSILCVWKLCWTSQKRERKGFSLTPHACSLFRSVCSSSQISNSLAWRLGTSIRAQGQSQVSTPNVERANKAKQSRSD